MISIIIPLYNKQNCIKKTIDSVIKQECTENYEIIVVDDGSTDNSYSIVRRIRSEKLKLIKKKNGGPSSARNTGVKAARGKWIIFLDADDVLTDGALQYFIDLSIKYPTSNGVISNFYVKKNDRLRLYSLFYSKQIVKNGFKDYLFNQCSLRAGALMIKKEIAIKYPFKEHLRRYEDLDFIFQILNNTILCRGTKPVMIYNCDELGASKPRKNPLEDYLLYLDIDNKTIWEKVACRMLYEEAIRIYPDYAYKIYEEKKFNSRCIIVLCFICKLWRYINIIVSKIHSFLCIFHNEKSQVKI